MGQRTQRAMPLLVVLLGVAACERWCPEELSQVRPRMVVSPERIESTAGVAQDTVFTVTVANPSNAELLFVSGGIRLDEVAGDPNFRIIEAPDMVFASRSAEVRVAVRPQVTGRIETTLILEAEPDALPNYAEVPIVVEALDLGLPRIVVEPREVDFARIGQNDVARASVTLRNGGVRDLILDDTSLWSAVPGDNAIRLINPAPPGWAVAPGESISLDLVFAPTDTQPREAMLQIHSNDPSEPLVEVPVRGRGSQCPVAVAELLDDADAIEPLDTVRIIGENSYAQTEGTEISSYEWVLEQRPVGSTAVVDRVADERVQLTCDIAGDYVMRLTVTDSDGVRSCNDALVRLHVEPSDELHIQLVWDHPTADLDLHLLRENGTIFSHDGDVYFSNRAPEWYVNSEAASNPTLDADDSRGYGPENINIERPYPGSRWRVFVHYWNKQTDGDAFTVASLRIYAYGQLVADLSQSLENDQTLWQAVEVLWPEEEGAAPAIQPIGQVEPYVRPF